ncbi:MAG: hypothetical protein MR006_03470 [Arcanobacterium sp.]|nr:hypothetical protein [Arcanobacterium sp.]
MSTPHDPYTSAQPDQPTDGPVLDPITSSTEPEAATSATVAYGDGDAIAWESAFAAEEESAQPEPELPHSDLSELTFDEFPTSAVLSNGGGTLSDGEAHTSAEAGGALTGAATDALSGAATGIGSSLTSHENLSDSPETTRTGRHLSDVPPLEEGATFASAYSATGVTELPEPEEPAAAEPEMAAPEAENSLDGPVRESVLPAGAAVGIMGAESPTTQWSKDPGAPRLTDIPEQPKSRVGAHIGSVFATLVLIPICWYLISDAGVRLNLVENNPWETGAVNIGALLELAGGFIALFVLWLMARASTLGAQLWGVVLTLAGLTAIVAPSLGLKVSAVVRGALWDVNSFTRNVAHHFDLDLGSGRIAIFGFLLFLTGLMIHLARKSAARRAEALTLREQILGSDQK